MICFCGTISFGPFILKFRPAQGNLLYQIKHSHSVADRREKMGAIGAIEQVALAVNSAQQVREL